MREANPGIASCAFDDCSAWFEEAALFGVFDHVEGGAVFDTAARVLKFCFSEDRARGFFGERGEFYKGRVANCFKVLVLEYASSCDVIEANAHGTCELHRMDLPPVRPSTTPWALETPMPYAFMSLP